MNAVAVGGSSLRALPGPSARRLNARLHGDDGPLILLSHGFGSDQDVWRGVIDHIGPGRRIVTHDLSYLTDAEAGRPVHATLSAYADDLTALLEEIDLGPVVYVGHSVSGMIGALAALSLPSAFSRLILMNASPRYLSAPDYDGGFQPQDLEGMYVAMRRDYHAWISGFAMAAVGEPAPEAIARFAESLKALRPDVAVRVARAIYESDFRAILPNLTVPTRLIHTRDDVAVPQSVALYMADRIPGAGLDWLDAAGHLPHLTHPGQVADALEPWL